MVHVRGRRGEDERDCFLRNLLTCLSLVSLKYGKLEYCGEPPPGASPLTTRRVRASVYEGTSRLTVHTVDPHTVDRSCTPYI